MRCEGPFESQDKSSFVFRFDSVNYFEFLKLFEFTRASEMYLNFYGSPNLLLTNSSMEEFLGLRLVCEAH